MSMKWMLAITVSLVAAGAGGALAQPPEGAPNQGPQGGPPWMQARIMFQRFDADRDGALTVDEVPENAWSHLSAADANEDGKVTQVEVMKFSAARIVGNFDTNEDGELTADEVPAPLWDRLQDADADENGSVSEAEIVATSLAAPRRGGPPAEGGRGGRPSGRRTK